MRITLDSAAQLGDIVRAARKAQGLRQDDAAGIIGVSENFLGKIESGGLTVQWGKVFDVLKGLGLHVDIDIDQALDAKVTQRLQAPARKRAARQAGESA